MKRGGAALRLHSLGLGWIADCAGCEALVSGDFAAMVTMDVLVSSLDYDERIAAAAYVA